MDSGFLHIVRTATLTLPAVEVALLLVLLTLCLAFGFCRIGLVAAYLFAYRWGWLVLMGHSEGILLAYLFFGSVTCILSVIAMWRGEK